MENNFIQMAASAGHAVAYTIGLIFKHGDHGPKDSGTLSFSVMNQDLNCV